MTEYYGASIDMIFIGLATWWLARTIGDIHLGTIIMYWGGCIAVEINLQGGGGSTFVAKILRDLSCDASTFSL